MSLFEEINITELRSLVRYTYEFLNDLNIDKEFKEHLTIRHKSIFDNATQSITKAHCSDWHINTF